MKPSFSCYVGTGLVPVRGYEGRVVYTERVYIWVVGVAPDPDTTSPPQADFPLSVLKAGQP